MQNGQNMVCCKPSFSQLVPAEVEDSANGNTSYVFYSENMQMQIEHELVYRASSVLLLLSAGMGAVAVLKANAGSQRGQFVKMFAVLNI